MANLPDPKLQAARARILVIEDEVLIRMFLSEELRDAGFAVIEAAHADEALSFFQSGEKVDLVFSDIHMPGSMNGLQLARKLKQTYPLLPVILTSGNPGMLSLDGLGPFISKPYLPDQALSVIYQTLGL